MFTQFNQKNLMCGAHSLPQPYKTNLASKGFLFDDTGDNISDDNIWMGDLTGLYWVWKNTDDEIVGTNHYRRRWNDDDIEKLEFNRNTIYVSKFIRDIGSSIEEQFIRSHGKIGLDILKYASTNEKIDISLDRLEKSLQQTMLSTCNMFFCDRILFNKICQILFEILFEIFEGTKYCLPFIQNETGRDERLRTGLLTQTRLLAFLSERILTTMYFGKNYYFGPNVQIEEVRFHTFQFKQRIIK